MLMRPSGRNSIESMEKIIQAGGFSLWRNNKTSEKPFEVRNVLGVPEDINAKKAENIVRSWTDTHLITVEEGMSALSKILSK